MTLKGGRFVVYSTGVLRIYILKLLLDSVNREGSSSLESAQMVGLTAIFSMEYNPGNLEAMK